MPLIKQAIPSQQFELIRDRVANILIDEFEGQFLLTYDTDLNIDVLLERSTPLASTEVGCIVVSLASGEYDNKNQGNIDGLYTFFIDHFSKAVSSSGISGDTLASTKLHKLMGVTRAILENPIYKTLGVTPPFIMKSYISEMNIRPLDPNDALNTSVGRLTFNVKANENTLCPQLPMIAGYDTLVQINSTSKGYLYSGNNY